MTGWFRQACAGVTSLSHHLKPILFRYPPHPMNTKGFEYQLLRGNVGGRAPAFPLPLCGFLGISGWTLCHSGCWTDGFLLLIKQDGSYMLTES